MTEKRTFFNKGYQHICQKSADNGIIFYSIQDYLVFFTLLCVKAAKHNLIIIAICIMLNHFHIECKFKSSRQMESFMNGLLSAFARMYNRQHHTKGQLFKKSFKNVQKSWDDQISNTYIYIENNPKVKFAVEKSEDYRWNFLKYSISGNPFSEPIVESEASPELLRLIAEVQEAKSEGKALSYGFFGKTFAKLSQKEINQLTDSIIRTYSVIDYSFANSKYGGYEEICKVLDMVTGADYEMKESDKYEDYLHYEKMIELSAAMGVNLEKGHVKTLSDKKLKECTKVFLTEAKASIYEISKFLHISEERVEELLG